MVALKRAPFVAGMGISLADPGGPIEALEETAAMLRTATSDTADRGDPRNPPSLAASAASCAPAGRRWRPSDGGGEAEAVRGRPRTRKKRSRSRTNTLRPCGLVDARLECSQPAPSFLEGESHRRWRSSNLFPPQPRA